MTVSLPISSSRPLYHKRLEKSLSNVTMEAKFVDPQQNLVLQIWRQFRSVCLQRSSMLSQNRLIGERTTTIPNMLSFLNILKDVMKGSVRGQNQPKDSCCLDSPQPVR